MKKLLIVGLIVTACGGKNQDSTVDFIPAEVAEKVENQAEVAESLGTVYLTENDLPTCDESRKAHIAYVNDDKEFYGCDGDGWKPLIVKNEAEVTQEKMVNCFLDHTSTDSTVAGLNYVYIRFSDGTAMANVQAYTSYDSVANTLLWGAGTVGAQQGIVNFVFGGKVHDVFMSEDQKTLKHSELDVTDNTRKEYEMSTEDANCSF